MVRIYEVRLLANDLLEDLNVPYWTTHIAAGDVAAAWARFKNERMAPIYRTSTEPSPQPLAIDYDVRFHNWTS